MIIIRGCVTWKRVRISILLLLLLVVLYSRFVEIRWIAVTHVPVELPHLPAAFNGLTIAQLSDLHYPDYLSPDYFRRLVKMTNDQHPDLIVLTGDLIPGSEADVQPCAQILSQLHAPLGVYAIFGNHDYWAKNTTAIIRTFSNAGITVLRNKSVPFTRNQARLWLVGLDDFWTGSTNPEKALHGVPADEEKILLIHEPDYADDYSPLLTRVELQLSGHSHGGQVRLPFIGGVHYPPFSRHYPMGLYQVGERKLYTNRGAGLILPFRFNCRPEITLLTLHSFQ